MLVEIDTKAMALSAGRDRIVELQKQMTFVSERAICFLKACGNLRAVGYAIPDKRGKKRRT